jgi:Tfp pilus assembly protein PilF
VKPRLESWKEIAAHFGRRVRTVQRWEKEEGLPVHRHAHRSRGTISAVPEELDTWWASRTESPDGGPGKLRSSASLPSSPVIVSEAKDLPPPSTRSLGPLGPLGIVGAAAVLVLVAAKTLAPAPPPADESVSPRVLEARYLINRGSPGEIERAMALCGAEAARADTGPSSSKSERAAAHECLAHGALARARIGRGPLAEGLLEATRQAETTLALDPRRADAIAIAAWAGFIRDWNAVAAESGYRRAIALDPASGLPHHGLAHLLSTRGRHDEAISELRRAQRAQPLSAALNDDGCWFFYRARRFDDALAEAERGLRLEPQRAGTLQCVMAASAARGELAAARDAAVTILRTIGDPAAEAIAAAPAAEAVRRFDRRMLERLDERRAVLSIPATPYTLLHAELGDRDQTIAWLERAYADRDPVLLLVRVHPAFDSIRSDPRLEPLLRRAGV